MRSRTTAWRLAVAICTAALLVLAMPLAASALAKNASLVHVGPTGLESYNAWTKKGSTLVHGMWGSWYYPVLSPHGSSAVTMAAGRSDRAYFANIYGASISSTSTPIELTLTDADGWPGMTGFAGWLDDYTAVVQQSAPDGSGDEIQIARDVRTGAWRYYDGSITYPLAGRKRTWFDKKDRIAVSRSQIMTISVRTTKKRVARFKVPGAGNGRSVKGWFFADASISPDGKYIAYQLWCTPSADSQVIWRTYVCQINGKGARRISNSNGGFVWR